MHKTGQRRLSNVARRSLAATCLTLVLAGCDVVPVGSYTATSTSMEPAIKPDDHVFAWSVTTGSLKRGDIVVVDNGGMKWMMRIAALPGDTIAMIDGTVVLNGRAITQRPVGTYTVEQAMRPGDYAMFEEQFPGEETPHRVLDMGPGVLDNMAEIALPEGSFFLLGDNRDNAADSRIFDRQGAIGLGIVERQQITGRVYPD